MNKIISILASIAVAMLLTGCENTFDVSTKAGNVLSVAINTLNQQQSFNVGEKYKAELWVQRAGLQAGTGKVKFVVESALLDSLNKADLTNYKLLPETCYEMAQTEFVVNTPEVCGYITYDPEKILALSEYDNVEYVLPLRMTSTDMIVNPERNVSFFSFKVSEPIVQIMNPGTFDVDLSKTTSLDVKVGVPFTNKWKIVCNLLHDQSLVDQYNITNKVNYVMLPEKYYTVPETTILESGANSISATYKLNDNLLPGNYLLPVRIGSINASLDNIPTDALVADNQSSTIFNIVKMGEKMNKTNWEVIFCSSAAAVNPASNLIDGNDETFWHCKTKSEAGWSEPPYNITIDMKKNIQLAQIDLLNRGESGRANNIKWVEFYASMDNVNWMKIGASNFNDEFVRVRFRYYVQSTAARYLKLVIPEGHGNVCPPAAIRELDVYGLALN